MSAVGRMEGAWVRIEDPSESSRLFSRGFFGTPSRKGSLLLPLHEAFHLVESGKLRVFEGERELSGFDLLEQGEGIDPRFLSKAYVVHDLRSRGVVAKEGRGARSLDFFPRGGIPGKTPAQGRIFPFLERDPMDFEEWWGLLRDARAHGSTFAGVVDGEGETTYYEFQVVDPKGSAPAHLDLLRKEGFALRFRKEGACLIPPPGWSKPIPGHFGQRLGRTVHLFPDEARFLREEGDLPLHEGGGPPEKIPSETYEVYRDLRRRDLAVKTGFKYGTHFRVYAHDPSHAHAPFLVHCTQSLPWIEVAGFVRLSHAVRKRMVFAHGAGRYLEISWKRL